MAKFPADTKDSAAPPSAHTQARILAEALPHMVVITGSVVTTVDIAAGDRLDFVLEDVGEVSLSAT